jgi:large subunit ribosomal protein L22
MSKPKRERPLTSTESRARTSTIKISPQKLNLVAQLIRGKKVATALADLTFSRKRIARDVKKTLESAVANAENKKTIDIDNLFVKTIWVDMGPSMKRFRPRAQGRAFQVKKKMSHIHVILDEK